MLYHIQMYAQVERTRPPSCGSAMPADRPDAVPGLGFENIKVGDPVARILWCRIWCLDTMLLLDSVHRLSSILVCPSSRICFRVPNSLSPVASIPSHWSVFRLSPRPSSCTQCPRFCRSKRHVCAKHPLMTREWSLGITSARGEGDADSE